jgi:uncharacterized protein (TIGR02266 family)
LKTRRRYERFIRRLEVEFSARGQTYRCISSNLSRGGLFVRTNHAFVPGTSLDLKVHLPDGTVSQLKGTVRMASKTPGIGLKNGMGIEITESDANYVRFVDSRTAEGEGGAATEEASKAQPHIDAPRMEAEEAPEFVFLSCSGCGARNRVISSKLSLGPRCGKCGAHLTAVV